MRRHREAPRLDVVVGTFVYTGTPYATYELGLSGPTTSKVVVVGSGADSYVVVLRGMLRALAVLGFRGEVRLRPAGNAFEDGGREAFAALERYAATLPGCRSRGATRGSADSRAGCLEAVAQCQPPLSHCGLGAIILGKFGGCESQRLATIPRNERSRRGAGWPRNTCTTPPR